MTSAVQLRRVSRFAYGDSLSSDSRVDGKYPVVGSGGVSGSHDKRNFGSPGIVIGRKGSYGSVHWIESGGFAIDTTYYIDKRMTTANLRWLYYVLQGIDLRGISQDVGVPGLSREAAYSVNIPSPPQLEEQRRIADFLDAETARIDKLAALRERQSKLLERRHWLALENLLNQTNWKSIPFRRVLLAIKDGPFGSAFSSSDYADDGAAVVRLGNIGFDEYRTQDQARIPMELYANFLRYRVRPDDVLIAALGDASNHAGRACVAPDLGPTIVKGKSLCATVDTKLAEPRYLSMVMSSNIGRRVFETRGSTRAMINIEIVKSAEIPFPPLKIQRQIVETVDEQASQGRRLLSSIDRQRDRLSERRQALITAAVTGEFDVSAANGRGIEK